MSRSIIVSTDVFAAIWADRQDGEETEDAILRRKFGCGKAEDNQPNQTFVHGNGGVRDTRNNVHFPRDFIAFRTYKRREYEAVAQDGAWLRRDTGDLYPTLNQLNASIAAGPENIWNGNWKYRTEDGSLRPISDLRR